MLLKILARCQTHNYWLQLQALSDLYYHSTCLSVYLSACVPATLMLNILGN